MKSINNGMNIIYKHIILDNKLISIWLPCIGLKIINNTEKITKPKISATISVYPIFL